ncbi:DUF4476 domain-containing protein [Pedobacter sp. PF22-3]|uniref:DUF4476 domain-containing protein n=1 Tax=Pedobacter sp. PF22-3 TaxID=2994467 RepID=UPI002248117D|nr:DUF4476 domain-containing protein [Pedobacter sp. PF22-3]MCX2494198.1 DUF4476 domain-containing protein [Pedobacter sp. PF22-3]
MKTTIFLGLAMSFATLSFAQNNRRSAEVFLEIVNPGKYNVYLDEELVSSAHGRFRFYDVYNSTPVLSIIQGNTEIFKQQVKVIPEQRLVLSLEGKELITLKQMNIFRNRQYALDDFDGYTGDYNTGIVPPVLPDPNYRLLSPEAFQEFYSSYKKSVFDSERVRLINAVSKNASFSSSQSKLILKTFTFDGERLKIAKSLYQTVVDPQNYFTVAETFEFPYYKDEFLKYLEKP